MSSVINSNNAPHPSVVKPHFIFGAISLLILSLMIILADTSLLGAYFDSKIVAITHMAVLGWASMIIFGALYQLIPVVFETSLFSEKLAKFTFWLAGSGVFLLTYAFWTADYTGLLPWAALVMFISLLLFVVNVILSYKNSEKKNISSGFVITAVVWLSVTELIGTLTAFNFKYNFFTEAHLHYLKIHATIGLIGWFLMLIIGVSSVLIPMFMVSHQLDHKKLKKSYYFINTGLLLMAVNWLFVHFEGVTPVFWLSIVIGIYYYISFVYDSYKNRIRKVLDIGMKHTMISILAISLPAVISLIILFGSKMDSMLLLRTTTIYGFTVIFGMITTIILGQTYKTLPFIIWLEKYQALVGKTKTPMPRELYSEKLADVHLYVYLLFVITVIAGLLFDSIWLVRAGSYLLLIVAVLYNINVFKIIFHQVKTDQKYD